MQSNPECIVCGYSKMIHFKNNEGEEETYNFKVFATQNADLATTHTVHQVYCCNCGIIYHPDSIL